MKTDLLKTRFIVVATIPLCKLKVGDILPVDEWNQVYIKFNGALSLVTLTDYPHLFRPLHWSEFRTLDEMPKYLKGASIMGKKGVAEVVFETQNDKIVFRNAMHTHSYFNMNDIIKNNYLPATETEYNNFINQEK